MGRGIGRRIGDHLLFIFKSQGALLFFEFEFVGLFGNVAFGQMPVTSLG